jgi:hypothetical protein
MTKTKKNPDVIYHCRCKAVAQKLNRDVHGSTLDAGFQTTQMEHVPHVVVDFIERHHHLSPTPNKRNRFSTKQLLDDLARLPQFKVTTKEKDWGMASCRSFYIRWFVDPEFDRGWICVQFAVKKTFDRWANSTDFKVLLHYEDGLYRQDIVKAHLWMEKVVRSGLFNFNSYFATIDAASFSVQNKTPAKQRRKKNVHNR